MLTTEPAPATAPATAPPGGGFSDFGLRPEVLRAIDEAGYTTPTPIQARAIPEVLARRDLIGIAQTGTGKTASFVLPMLHLLAAGRAKARMPRSLILSPTRELATQTARNFETYGKHLRLTMALIIGGVGMGDQERLLEKGTDVLIATPGRLLDWFERGKVMLGGVDILVIDEADRMFDMGFMPDVERIVTALLGRKLTLLFSATMPPEVRRLADRFLKDPAEIRVDPPATTAETVDDRMVEVEGGEAKKRALVGLIRSQAVPKAIVFCNRKRDIGGVMRHLQRSGLHARDLHGDLEQVHRQQTLDQFTRGEVDFLVATDVAARGLDISNMPVVVNFDVPINPEDYIHRIGRTGRAGRKGRAFTLVTAEDRKALGNIERLTKREIVRLSSADLPDGPTPPPAEGEAPGAEPPAPGRDRAGAGRGRRPGRRQAVAPEAMAEPAAVDAAAPPPPAEPPAPEAGEAERPAGRRRRRRPVEAAAATPPEAAAPTPPEAAAGGPSAVPAPDRAAPRGRERDRAAAAPPPRPGRERAAPPPPPPPTGRGRDAAAEPDRPVTGLGDHVPRFLLQPVPARLLRPRGEAAEPDDADGAAAADDDPAGGA